MTRAMLFAVLLAMGVGCSLLRLGEREAYDNLMLEFRILYGQVNGEYQRALDSVGRAERAAQRATGEGVNVAEDCFREAQDIARAMSLSVQLFGSMFEISENKGSLSEAQRLFEIAKNSAAEIQHTADLVEDRADCAQAASTGLP